MDWLTFIAELVKALAWPSAAILAVFLLRQPLLKTLRELKRLKWKDVEVEFDKAVEQVKIEAQKTLPAPSAPFRKPELQDMETRLLSLVEISPKAAVLDAWVQVEKEISLLLKRRSIPIDMTPRINLLQMADLVRRHELLDDHGFWLFNSLRQLRNRAAHEHEEEITEDGALSFISMASDLIRKLKEK